MTKAEHAVTLKRNSYQANEQQKSSVPFRTCKSWKEMPLYRVQMPVTWRHSLHRMKGSQCYSHSSDILQKQTNSVCYKWGPSWQQNRSSGAWGRHRKWWRKALLPAALIRNGTFYTPRGIQILITFGVHSAEWHPGLSCASFQVSHTCPWPLCPLPLTPSLLCVSWLEWHLSWPTCYGFGVSCFGKCVEYRQGLLSSVSLRSQQSCSPAVDKSLGCSGSSCVLSSRSNFSGGHGWLQSVRRPRISRTGESDLQ